MWIAAQKRESRNLSKRRCGASGKSLVVIATEIPKHYLPSSLSDFRGHTERASLVYGESI